MDEIPVFVSQLCERLRRAGDDAFESELALLREDIAVTSKEKITKLRQDLSAEKEVALNARGVDKAELALACSLSLSTVRSENFEAVKILEALIDRKCNQFEMVLFWLAVARYHVGEFREARICCEKLLLRKPDESLARRLLESVRGRARRDGYAGLGVVVAVAIVSAIAGNYFGALRRAS